MEKSRQENKLKQETMNDSVQVTDINQIGFHFFLSLSFYPILSSKFFRFFSSRIYIELKRGVIMIMIMITFWE